MRMIFELQSEGNCWEDVHYVFASERNEIKEILSPSPVAEIPWFTPPILTKYRRHNKSAHYRKCADLEKGPNRDVG